MANSDSNTWPADIKNAEGHIDPNVLPEYTLLPASPPQSVVSYDANDHPEPGTGTGDAPSPTTTTTTCATESQGILKLLYMGLLAIVVPPIVCSCAGLAAGAMVLYGCGKILEGVGRALAFGPEVVYRAWVARRADAFVHAVRASGVTQEGAREEVVLEGQVALEDVDVEAGRGGPISI